MHQSVATTECSDTHKYTHFESAVARASVCGVGNVISHRGGTVAVTGVFVNAIDPPHSSLKEWPQHSVNHMECRYRWLFILPHDFISSFPLSSCFSIDWKSLVSVAVFLGSIEKLLMAERVLSSKCYNGERETVKEERRQNSVEEADKNKEMPQRKVGGNDWETMVTTVSRCFRWLRCGVHRQH